MANLLPERNHSVAKTPSPFIRYFKARMQPFKRPLFWGSAAILTILAVGIWQYWTRSDLDLATGSDVNSSELTNGVTEQEAEIEPSQGETAEGFPSLPPSAIVNEDPSASKAASPTNGFLRQNNEREQTESAEAEANSVFTPLTPGQKSQPSNPFAASEQELLDRSAMKDYRSLLGGSSSGEPADASQSSATAQADLPMPSARPVPSESSLEKAVNRVFAESSSSSRTPAPATAPTISPQPSTPPAGTGGAPAPSFSAEFNNSFRPAARSYQSPYPVTSGSPNPTTTPSANPANPVGSSITNTYTNTSPSPYGTGGQAIPPAQPQTTQYQGTNRTSYYTTPNPVPNQYQQQNPYAPQVQEPVRMDSPLFP